MLKAKTYLIQLHLHSSTMPPIKAIFFDFMGTCLNWHASITSHLPQAIPEETRSRMALAWREAFFAEIHARHSQGLEPLAVYLIVQTRGSVA